MDEVVREFLVESHENLDRLDRELVALEERPGDRELLASVFRTIHTIKGTSGFLGLQKLEAVAHAGESLLARLRDGELRLNAAITSALLATVDAIRAMLRSVETAGDDGPQLHDDLVGTLQRLQSPDAPGAANEAGTAEPARAAQPVEAQDAHGGVADGCIRVDVSLLDQLVTLVGELVLSRNQVLKHAARSKDAPLIAGAQRLSAITTELQERIMKTRMQPIGTVWAKLPRLVRDLSAQCNKQVRVEMEGQDTELDKTILEAIKDPLTHLIRNAIDHGIEPPDERRAAGKPSEGTLRLRSFHEGGQVHIEISDDGAGIDIERVKAIAIEREVVTRDRLAALGERDVLDIIFLPGFSTSRQVTSVSGRGVGMDVVKTNIERIGGAVDVSSVPGRGATFHVKIPLTLAIVPALVVECRGDRYAIPQLGLQEVVHLDADGKHGRIESIHGAPVYRLRGNLLPIVHLERVLWDDAKSSQPATKFRSTSGSETYRPDRRNARCNSTTVAEAWRPSPSATSMAPASPVVNAAAACLPARLQGRMGCGHKPALWDDAAPHPRADGASASIVVLQADGRSFGLVVDRIGDSEEIVVKALDACLRDVPVFAGATIMGDGKVALILDVLGLAQRARVIDGKIDESHERSAGMAAAAGSAEGSADPRTSWLIVRGPDDGRLALPLSAVARLEQIPASSVEHADGKQVVQHRGKIMPLVRLSDALEERRRKPRGATADTRPGDRLDVVVCPHGAGMVGIVVDRIIDAVAESIAVRSASTRRGVLGCAVLQGRVTELVDVPAVLAARAGG